MLKPLAWLAVPAALVTLSTPAEAAPRSLAAATARLPESVHTVATSHVKAIRSTKLFTKLFPALLEEADELAEGIKMIKKTCQIDPVVSIEDATFAGEGSGDDGVVFVGLTGVDEAKATSCATKVAKAELGADAKVEKVTSKADGTLYKVSSERAKKEVYFAWLPGEVVAVGTDEDDKALIERMLSGKGNLKKSKVASRLSKLDPNAALSGVTAKEETVEGKKVKGGDVKVVIQGGTVIGDATVEMESSKDAQEVVSLLEVAKAFLGKKTPGSSMEARASGSNVVVRAQVPEQALIDLAGGAMRKKR